jgi:hypothetical protein
VCKKVFLLYYESFKERLALKRALHGWCRMFGQAVALRPRMSYQKFYLHMFVHLAWFDKE